MKGRLLWLSLFLLLIACSSKEPSIGDKESVQLFQQQRIEKYEQFIYPAVLKQIESGDLIFRLGSDMTSEMFREMNKTDKSFSHCGIASIENDSAFVYHAIGGEFNPDQKIKREPIFTFGHAAENKGLAIYRTTKPVTERNKIATAARKFFQQAVPFDMQFNYQTEDRLYCAEFVAKCISRSLQDSSWLHFSTIGKLHYVSIDNLFLSRIMQAKNRWAY